LANVESGRDQLSGQLEDCLTLAESAHDLRMQLEKAIEDAEATEIATSLRVASAQKEIDRLAGDLVAALEEVTSQKGVLDETVVELNRLKVG